MNPAFRSGGNHMMKRSAALGVAAAALAGGLAAAACGGTTSPAGPGASSGAASSGTASTAGASTGAASTGAAGGTGQSVAGVPFYQPSTTVSQAVGSVVLSSPDPVPKVSAFYVNAVGKGGWTTVSKSITQYSASLTVKKAGQGASISVAPGAGTGTVITISTYPSP